MQEFVTDSDLSWFLNKNYFSPEEVKTTKAVEKVL